MNWKVTTKPTVEPVELVDAKLHLRIENEHTDEDGLIATHIATAREFCEGYQNRAYLMQTITMQFDRFPIFIEVPLPPLQSVTSIKYYDTNGDQQTLDSSVYKLDKISEPGKINLAYGASWPVIRGDINGVEVVCVCGNVSANDVVARVKQAMLLIIGHLYENRELTTPITIKELPFAVNSLLSLDRIGIV